MTELLDLKYGYPCNVAHKFLKDLVFEIDHKKYKLTWEEYTIRQMYQGTEYCFPAVMAMPFESPIQIILGDTFLRKYYTHYDIGKKRVGFYGAAFINLISSVIAIVFRQL